ERSSQIAMRFSEVGFHTRRLAITSFGIGEAAAFQKRHAEIAVRPREVRLDSHGGAIRFDRGGRDALGHPYDAEIVVREKQSWFQRDRLHEGVGGFVEMAAI